MSEKKRMKFGLLLPHFGVNADKDRLLEGSKLAESYGFDSVWVRDHLVFEPHGEMEDPNRNFYDALITLTAIGAVTERIELGTGSLIPFRHPLEVALWSPRITQLVGPRLILGYGAGTFDHEFEAVGIDPDAEALGSREGHGADAEAGLDGERRLLRRRLLQVRDVTIEPKPVGGPPPFWYCGNTPASVRRAVEYCEGWMPGRISLATFRARVAALREQSEARGGRCRRPPSSRRPRSRRRARRRSST